MSHCVEVATILADLQLDSTTVAAALLHDVVEDTDVSARARSSASSATRSPIVDGLTKIADLHVPLHRGSGRSRTTASCCCRSRRMRASSSSSSPTGCTTCARSSSCPEEKRRRIAQETRDLYAPLAHRFGMAKMRWELEDLAFKHLEPEEYRTLREEGRAEARRARGADRAAARSRSSERAAATPGITDVEVTGRPKHLWSIYKKMKQRDKPYEEIYDLLAIRVLVNSVPDCYHALGVIHDGWTPVQERIKDYIAQPEVERLPVAAHDGVRAGPAAVRDPDPHARDAPHRGLRHRRALAVQGGREERRTSSTATSPGSGRCSSCSWTPRRRTSSSSS